MSPLATGTMAKAEGKHGIFWGFGSTKVRTSSEELLAYLWDGHTRSRVSSESPEVIESPNMHRKVTYIVKKAPLTSLRPRDFCSELCWKRTVANDSGNDEILFVSAPATRKSRPETTSHFRGENHGIFVLTKGASENDTQLQLYFRMLSGSDLPLIVRRAVSRNTLNSLTMAQQYFQGLRKMINLDEKDGEAIGEAFMIKTKSEKSKEGGLSKYELRVAHVIAAHVSLKEFASENPWFPSLVIGMLSNRINDAKTVQTKLCTLSSLQAFHIGKSLSKCLKARKTADAGVDQVRKRKSHNPRFNSSLTHTPLLSSPSPLFFIISPSG